MHAVAMSPGLILLRTAFGMVFGSLLLFLGWLLPDKKETAWRWVVPAFGVIGILLVYAGAIGFAETLAKLVLKSYFQDAGTVPRILVLTAAFVGMAYAVVISTQLIKNGARLLQGKKPNRIEWIRRSRPKRRPAHKGSA